MTTVNRIGLAILRTISLAIDVGLALGMVWLCWTGPGEQNGSLWMTCLGFITAAFGFMLVGVGHLAVILASGRTLGQLLLGLRVVCGDCPAPRHLALGRVAAAVAMPVFLAWGVGAILDRVGESDEALNWAGLVLGSWFVINGALLLSDGGPVHDRLFQTRVQRGVLTRPAA